MGASLGGLGPEANDLHDLHSGDLGPQEPWRSFPLGTSCSFEAAGRSSRLRPREATAAGRSFSFWVAEDGEALEAPGATDFVLEVGLLGEGLSIRSLQRPLDYVRVQSEHFILSPYDGTQRFRGDATFELRRGELDGAAAGSGEACDWVCLMLAKRPGLYAHVEKEGQITAKPYCYWGREAFHFKLLQRDKPCASLLWDVSEPSMGLNSSTLPATADAVPSTKEDLKLRFLPTFSLPAYDSYDFHRLALPAAPTKSVCDSFEKVD